MTYVGGTLRFRYIYKRRTAILSVLYIVNNVVEFVCLFINRRGKGIKVYLTNLEHIQVHVCD